jgi:glycerol uptake operon antiterminator
MYIERVLEDKPIIAAVKEMSDFEDIPEDKIDVIFILRSSLSQLREMVTKAIDLDTLVFLHLDMVKGIGKDKEAVNYLAEEIGIDGIVSTKSYLIKAAKKEDLLTIQRLFLLDSESLRTGVNIISNVQPDLVEVLPGPVVPMMIDQLASDINCPIIAGGLVRSAKQVEELMQSGTAGISSSKQELWESNFNK